MKLKIKSKRADEILFPELIYSLLTLALIAILFLFVSVKSQDYHLSEQVYAKEISLLINEGNSGDSIIVETSGLFELARKNKYSGEIVKIDSENKKVIVKLSDNSGYSYGYFNGAEITGKNDRIKEQFTINIK